MTQTSERRYAGLSADERDNARRERLLAAMRELVGTIGYAATSVDRVCTAAKVSTRDFYRAYTSKEDAFLDLYSTLIGQSFASAHAVFERGSGVPLGTRISAMTLAYIEPMLSDLRVARINFVESVGISTRVEEQRLAFRENLIRLFEREGQKAVARGEDVARDFRFAALALIGAANAIVYDWAQRPDRGPHEALEESLAALARMLFAE